MSVHDWSRVDANLFHDFHQAWSVGIRNALNGGMLPLGHSALLEQHAGGLLPDVYQAKDEISAARANRITIRHPLGEVVSVIEIVSPGNKSSRRALRAFVDKTVGFLEQGVHVLVVDLFPPSVLTSQPGRAARTTCERSSKGGCLTMVRPTSRAEHYPDNRINRQFNGGHGWSVIRRRIEWTRFDKGW